MHPDRQTLLDRAICLSNNPGTSTRHEHGRDTLRNDAPVFWCSRKLASSFPPDFRNQNAVTLSGRWSEQVTRYAVAVRDIGRDKCWPTPSLSRHNLSTVSRSVTATASRKPLKSIVEDEDSRFLVSVGAVFGVTLATCGLLVVNALDTRVEAPTTKAVQPADVGIAPIVSSKPVLPDTTLKMAPALSAPPRPTPKGTAPPSAPKEPSAPTAAEGTAPPPAGILAGVAVVAALGGAAAFTQQQAAGAPAVSGSVASSKAEAQAWIAAWRARTGVDAAVRKRQAQAWIAAWRARTQ